MAERIPESNCPYADPCPLRDRDAVFLVASSIGPILIASGVLAWTRSAASAVVAAVLVTSTWGFVFDRVMNHICGGPYACGPENLVFPIALGAMVVPPFAVCLALGRRRGEVSFARLSVALGSVGAFALFMYVAWGNDPLGDVERMIAPLAAPYGLILSYLAALIGNLIGRISRKSLLARTRASAAGPMEA